MIGIFDSGIGGLGVASLLRKKAPMADFVYFGDLANMPYGPRSTAELFRLTMRAMAFLGKQGVSEYVTACNSVSVSVIQPLMDQMAQPTTRVIEMVGPAAKALQQQMPGRVLVAATEATVRSGIYERALRAQGIEVEMIALPELAQAIENDANIRTRTRIIKPAIQKSIEINASTLVFGCTQFPFVRNIFESLFNEQQYRINFFDPSEAVADSIVREFDVNGNGLSTFFVSKQSDVFERTVERLFGLKGQAKLIDVDKFVDKTVQEEWIISPFQTCTSLTEC